MTVRWIDFFPSSGDGEERATLTDDLFAPDAARRGRDIASPNVGDGILLHADEFGFPLNEASNVNVAANQHALHPISRLIADSRRLVLQLIRNSRIGSPLI